MQKYIYGFHAIEEFLKQGAPAGRLLVAEKSRRSIPVIELARKKQVKVDVVSPAELDRICDPKRHKGMILLPAQGMRSVKEDYKAKIRQIEKPHPLVILLDEITDPHNYGALLRSADQFYADLVISTEHKAARETDAAAAAAAGANVYLEKAAVTNLVPVIEFLKEEGYWIYGADLQGQAVHTLDFKGKTGLILGSEGKGIRRLVKEKCDLLVRIPARGHVDSFNVSVAGGILMYEIRRQQQFSI